MCFVNRNHNHFLYSLMTYAYGFVVNVTRRVILVEQKLDLQFYCRSLFVFCPFSFGHGVVCPSSIYGFRFPHCYLETLLIDPEYPELISVFLWVRFAKSRASCVVLLEYYQSFSPLSFGQCIVCSSNYDFCLPLGYLHPFLSFCICILDIIQT